MRLFLLSGLLPALAKAASPLKKCRAGWLAAPLLLAGLASCSHDAPATATPATAAVAPLATSAALPATAVPVAPPPPAAASAAPPIAAAKSNLKASAKVVEAAPSEVAAAPAAAPVAEAPAAPAPAPVVPATRTQAGRVLDEAGQPLVGATILLKGSTKGTSTDASGSYSLEVPTGENTFLFGYGGYQDEVVQNHDGQPITVTLLPTPGAPRSRKRR